MQKFGMNAYIQMLLVSPLVCSLTDIDREKLSEIPGSDESVNNIVRLHADEMQSVLSRLLA